MVMHFLTIVFLTVVSNIVFALEIGNCELKNIQKNLKNYIDGFENHLHHNYAICSIYILENSTNIAAEMANYFLAYNNCSNYVFQYSTSNYSTITNVLRSSEGNFIFADSISEIPYYVEMLIDENIWTTDGYTYFISPDKELDKALIRKSLQFLWEKGIYYYVVVFVYDVITIINYNPFVDEIVDITNCNPCLYFNTVLNMHRYPLRISFHEKTPNLMDNLIESKSSDVAEVVKDVIKMMNATPKFIDSELSFEGVKKLLNAYKTDVCLSSLFLLELQFEESSYLIDYVFNKVDKLVVVVAKGKPTIGSLKIILIYDLTTWLTILLTIIAFSCLFKLIERRVPFHSWLFISVQIILQIPVFRINRFKKYLSVFVIAWVMFTIVGNIVFQTNLFSVFIHDDYSEPLNTLQGVAESRMKLVGKRFQLAKVAPKFKKNELIVRLSNEMYEMLNKPDTSVGYVLEHEIAVDYVSSVKDDKYSAVFHIVHEAVEYGFHVYMLQKISPYHRSIKKIINLRKQYTAVKNKGKNASKKYYKSRDVIKIVDLVGLFMMLVVGEVLSIIVFLFELFGHKVRKYLMRRNR